MSLRLPAAPDLDAARAPALRWGVVGTGIGSAFVASIHQHTPQRAVAIAAVDPEKTRRAAAALGIERCCTDVGRLIDDPEVDAVYIATPHPTHLRIALAAIAAGKPVLVEKPVAMSAAEATELYDAAHAAGVLAMEAMWSRYLPQARIVDQVLADGMIGEVHLVRADFGFSLPYDPRSRLWSPDLGGGALLDAGIYPISLSSQVLGTPEDVVVTGTLAPGGVDASANLLLQCAGAGAALVSTSSISALPARAEIVGTSGRIDLAPPFFAPTEVTVTTGHWGAFESGSWRHPGSAPDRTASDGYAWQAVAFAQYVADGRPESPLHTHAESISIMATIDDARAQLADAGRRAPVPFPDEV